MNVSSTVLGAEVGAWGGGAIQEKQNTWSDLRAFISPLGRGGKQECKQHAARKCGRNIALRTDSPPLSFGMLFY